MYITLCRVVSLFPLLYVRACTDTRTLASVWQELARGISLTSYCRLGIKQAYEWYWSLPPQTRITKRFLPPSLQHLFQIFLHIVPTSTSASRSIPTLATQPPALTTRLSPAWALIPRASALLQVSPSSSSPSLISSRPNTAASSALSLSPMSSLLRSFLLRLSFLFSLTAFNPPLPSLP